MVKNVELSELAVVGVDIGKGVFHLVGFDDDGTLVLRKKIKRLALVTTFEKLPRCVVGMEACMSAHFVSRTLRKLGFEPRIIPAKYVKPFNKGQKNDYNDAEAIAEAALRPNMHWVSEKTQDQLDLQALHRVRSRLVSKRTATINQIRAFCLNKALQFAPACIHWTNPCLPFCRTAKMRYRLVCATSSPDSMKTGSGWMDA